MKIGGEAKLEAMSTAAWTLFANQAGLGLPLVRRRVQELAELVPEKVRGVLDGLAAPGLDAKALDGLATQVNERAWMTLQSLRKA